MLLRELLKQQPFIEFENEQYYYKVLHISYEHKKIILDVGNIVPMGFQCDLEDVIFEEFTGAYDKYKAPIYKGDICSYIDITGKEGEVTIGFENYAFIIFKGLAILPLSKVNLNDLIVKTNVNERNKRNKLIQENSEVLRGLLKNAKNNE